MSLESGRWSFDTAKTQQRHAELDRFYRERGLNAEAFACRHFTACAASQRPGTVRQYSGGTAGLTPLYDAAYDGTPIRVFIIGKENAFNRDEWPLGVAPNFQARSDSCRDTLYSTRRTNHIIGTQETLQYIFGVESRYLYACYALGNALRCGFQKAEVAENTSSLTDTSTMRANCLPYLVDEIRILEPTLVITQGRWSVEMPVVETLAAQFEVEPRTIMTNEKNGLYGLYEFPGFMLITSHHPARLHFWRDDYAPDSLWPMLDHLKATGYLPTVQPEDARLFEPLVQPVVDAMPR